MKERRNKIFFLYIVSLLVASGFTSCSKRPSNVLSDDKMVSLMADMELSEAYTNTQGNLSAFERKELGNRVLKTHGVSEETLDTTLAWYGRNIDSYSKLFERVDKEIERRRSQYTENVFINSESLENIWPYSSHILMSPLSGSDAFSFSLNHPTIKKGEVLDLSFYLPNQSNLKGTFGIEYKDGTGEATVANFTSKKKIEMKLYTDSSKVVSRLYGIMYFKEMNAMPVYIDSMYIKALPFDSTEYRSKRRSQKNFGKFPEPLDTTVN